MRKRVPLFLLLLLPVLPAYPQRAVDMRNTHERVLVIVPMTGSGTYQDPRRPLFAPVPAEDDAPALPEGILAFSYQVSDDGRFALLELVARDAAALDRLLKDRPEVAARFDKGKTPRAAVEREFRKYRKSFNLDRFGVSVP